MSNRRLPRADKKLLLPGEDRQASEPQGDKILMPGDDTRPPEEEAERERWKPTVYLEEQLREIDASTLAEEHQGLSQVHKELDKKHDSEDWGDGFTAFPEPAHILRRPDGSIARVTPLSEIPGVELSSQEEEEIAAVEAERPKPVPMNRDQRHKLKAVLAGRLWKYYKQLPMEYPGYNPFRDGLPLDLPAGDPRRLAPQGQELTPSTDREIYDWLYEFVGKRASVVDKRKFGGGIQDLALRIE